MCIRDRGNGGTIDVNEMEKLLGIPVVPISASKNEGIGELVDHALHVARFQEPPVRQDFCAPDEHDGAVHRCLHGIMALIEDHAERAGIPPRFAASKLAEGDRLVLERLDLDQNEKDALEHIISQMEAERGLDPVSYTHLDVYKRQILGRRSVVLRRPVRLR